MADKSRDLSIIEAREALLKLGTNDEIIAFIEGDERKAILKLVLHMIDKTGKERFKQGQTGKITEIATGDDTEFRGSGIEGKKQQEKEKGYVTCEDVIEKMRHRGVKI